MTHYGLEECFMGQRFEGGQGAVGADKVSMLSPGRAAVTETMTVVWPGRQRSRATSYHRTVMGHKVPVVKKKEQW
jgi:hypothetical protein